MTSRAMRAGLAAVANMPAPAFPPNTTRYWYQAGANFFMYDTVPDTKGEFGPENMTVCTWPYIVKSGDFMAATAARRWFFDVWCPRNNLTYPLEIK